MACLAPLLAGPGNIVAPGPSPKQRYTTLDPAGGFSPARFGRSRVGLLLGDALAQRHADETGDLDRRADLLGGLLDDLFHPALAVDDIELLEQHHVLVILAQTAFDHLTD